MSKLPVLKDRELLRILKDIGFNEHRQNGTSHCIMKHSDGRRVTVPIHPGRDIPTGTLRSIIRDIGVTPDQLQELL